MWRRDRTQSVRHTPLPVNQCLENPPVAEVSSDPDALPPAAEVEAHDPAMGGEDESAPGLAGKGRVLLLEDDASFKELIRDFLTENGYAVVAVANGGEGVREVLGNDFSLVLCDLMMPTLAGDMFYRAVERIRPGLCERFVFMSGYRGDEKTNEFIRKFNVTVLRKPFHLKDLLDTIAFTEARSGLQKAFETATAVPLPPRVASPSIPAPTPEPPRPRVVEAPAPPHSRAPVAPPSLRSISAPPAMEPQQHPAVAARLVVMARYLLLLALAVFLGFRYLDARDRATTAASERQVLDGEWRVVTAQLEQAEQVRSNATTVLRRAKRIGDERNAERWTKALRAISSTAGVEIEIRGVTTAAEAQGVWGFQVDGIATGRAPREIADEFFRRLRRELERDFSKTGLMKLEKLEDESEPTPLPPERRRAHFAISIKLGAKEVPTNESGVGK